MLNKKSVLVIAVLVVAAFLAAYYFYFLRKPPQKGAVGTAESVSKSVPKITTNPAEKVPEINPLDRANPFKYKNPLK